MTTRANKQEFSMQHRFSGARLGSPQLFLLMNVYRQTNRSILTGGGGGGFTPINQLLSTHSSYTNVVYCIITNILIWGYKHFFMIMYTVKTKVWTSHQKWCAVLVPICTLDLCLEHTLLMCYCHTL